MRCADDIRTIYIAMLRMNFKKNIFNFSESYESYPTTRCFQTHLYKRDPRQDFIFHVLEPSRRYEISQDSQIYKISSQKKSDIDEKGFRRKTLQFSGSTHFRRLQSIPFLAFVGRFCRHVSLALVDD